MKPITLILPYYDNPGMLKVQQEAWGRYPEELREQLHVIVVDDGSPRAPALPHVVDSGVASFRLYRITKDVRWNWIACRNLAMSVASTQWCLMTDIDHVLPEKTLRALVSDEHNTRHVFRFARVDAPRLTPYKPHPNTWFLTRKMFDQVGGYDERFSGFYGTDADFRDRVQATARAVVMLSTPMIRYPREVVSDASTTTYGRKEPQDHDNVARIRLERSRIPDWRPLRGTFAYEQLI